MGGCTLYSVPIESCRGLLWGTPSQPNRVRSLLYCRFYPHSNELIAQGKKRKEEEKEKSRPAADKGNPFLPVGCRSPRYQDPTHPVLKIVRGEGKKKEKRRKKKMGRYSEYVYCFTQMQQVQRKILIISSVSCTVPCCTVLYCTVAPFCISLSLSLQFPWSPMTDSLNPSQLGLQPAAVFPCTMYCTVLYAIYASHGLPAAVSRASGKGGVDFPHPLRPPARREAAMIFGSGADGHAVQSYC